MGSTLNHMNVETVIHCSLDGCSVTHTVDHTLNSAIIVVQDGVVVESHLTRDRPPVIDWDVLSRRLWFCSWSHVSEYAAAKDFEQRIEPT